MLNGELSWTLPSRGIRVAIWGKNLTDELIQNQIVSAANFDAVSYEKPRTYGVLVGLSL